MDACLSSLPLRPTFPTVVGSTTSFATINSENPEQSSLLTAEIHQLLKKAAIEKVSQQKLLRQPEKRRPPSSLQSEGAQSVCQCTLFQDGNLMGNLPTHSSEQLHDLHRSLRCISTHHGSSQPSTISSIHLGRSNVPVSDYTVRPISSPLIVYLNNSSYFGMGSSSRDSSQCLPRRLVDCSRYERPSRTPHEYSSAEALGFGLACKYEEVSASSYHQAGAPRISTSFLFIVTFMHS
ncbi:hypothetical protein CU097_015495 [Rhizopus azygosporus]|uniref:Uncharacterized protein n=1 Tax=Rhizopus azygosporus TaxID=86630 RepID=A0A367KFW4_RHIAZ|nr:hypothetical protein CU097_015495 [Rhizopus azygosporus]